MIQNLFKLKKTNKKNNSVIYYFHYKEKIIILIIIMKIKIKSILKQLNIFLILNENLKMFQLLII